VKAGVGGLATLARAPRSGARARSPARRPRRIAPAPPPAFPIPMAAPDPLPPLSPGARYEAERALRIAGNQRRLVTVVGPARKAVVARAVGPSRARAPKKRARPPASPRATPPRASRRLAVASGREPRPRSPTPPPRAFAPRVRPPPRASADPAAAAAAAAARAEDLRDLNEHRVATMDEKKMALRVSRITRADKLSDLISLLAERGHPLEEAARARWKELFKEEHVDGEGGE